MNKISIITITLLLQILSVNVFASEYIDPYIDQFAKQSDTTQEISTNPAFIQAAKERGQNKTTKKMYQCMLNHLQNVGSDVAARMIATACRELNRD